MLLAIDAGNTNIVFAVFEGEKLLKQWRISTIHNRTSDEYGAFLLQMFENCGINQNQIKASIISTVVPEVLFDLKKLSQSYFKCEPMVVGAPNIKIGIEIKLERPSEVGSDRLINSVAAFKKFGGDCIILDFGTATTFDVIDASGAYLGGIISPGINLSIMALERAAAKLPRITIEKPELVVGNSTVTAMQSGIFWGYISLIEGIVERIKKEKNCPMKTIATGGLASLFFKDTNCIDHLELDLTMFGLKYIYNLNK